jgi:hypothetical protein
MSSSGQQSPLGVNATSGLLQTIGLNINAQTAEYIGASTAISNYTNGTLISDTVLKNLTLAIRQGWVKYNAGAITSTTYNNLISIGSTTIPALGNTKPPSYTYTGSPNWGGASYAGQTASFGYVRLFSWQAYNEFNYNSTLSTDNNYTDFLGSFLNASSFIDQSNSSIMAMQNSLTFLQGTYSNMDDLISSDVTGVSLSTFLFGQDLINLGKAINLSTISTFGYPSNLLETLKRYSALTPSLSLALLASGLTPSEIEQVSSNINVTKDQQQKIYAAFLIIVGVDLLQILVPLNCKTTGLTTLADLLDVKKLFPGSYQSITVPVYNTILGLPTNSKTYYPIYLEGSTNSALTSPAIKDQIGTIIPSGIPAISPTVTDKPQILPTGFGSYLEGILPTNIATASGAFSMAMQQIRNISNVPIEKFAQVVSTIETTQNLNLVNSNSPADTAQAQAGIALIALGSGPYGTYTFSNFFGCMSGLPYAWAQLQTNIKNIQTSTLATIYSNLYTATQGSNPGLDAAIQAQIDLANAEIATILTNNPIANQLNTLWSNTGTQLNIEQRSRNTGLAELPSPRITSINTYPTVVYSFVDMISSPFAAQTQPNMAAQTLEAISNISNLTGQSIIGLMRSSRNQTRLNLAGITLDDTIPAEISPGEQSQWVGNGTVADSALAYPNDTEALGYFDATTDQYLINDTPISKGASAFPGSLAGSPYQNVVPTTLIPVISSSSLPTSQYSINDAIDNVVACNCDCWVQ